MLLAPRDLVIVKVVYENKIENSSLFIPDVERYGTKSLHMDYYGIVKAVGIDCKLDIKVDDKILFTRNEGMKIKMSDGEELVSLKQRHIEGIYDS